LINLTYLYCDFYHVISNNF